MTNGPVTVTQEPVASLSVVLRVPCGRHPSMTQADGTALTLKVVWLVR